mmetsp:Transcript_6128/g.11624  ORF Transcript_6128/g.11624 Transcript_6128/m.11624 type:complete len:106 (+) Transcript_6128:2763-3080(+)
MARPAYIAGWVCLPTLWRLGEEVARVRVEWILAVDEDAADPADAADAAEEGILPDIAGRSREEAERTAVVTRGADTVMIVTRGSSVSAAAAGFELEVASDRVLMN